MSKKLIVLFCVLAALTLAASAAAPILTITPSAVVLPRGATQLFTASFNDGSVIKGCVWNATGIPPNAVQGNYEGNTAAAAFTAGTMPGQYVVTATCSNTNGITELAVAPVTIH